MKFFLKGGFYMIKGIDISEHDGNVDMLQVKKSGIQFIILRFGYGKNATSLPKTNWDA